jgi:O-acetyl-ADP-ribose deacetylase (regulator of RNase III)
MKKIKIILGDITYPKSEAIIIPANAAGVMNGEVQSRVVREGWEKIAKEAKKETKRKKYNLGDTFVTDSGRLKRRGVKKIYHSVIRNLPGDLISTNIIKKALQSALRNVILDKNKSVSICGIGLDCDGANSYIVADITVRCCFRYKDRIDIKIIDDNKEFIGNINKVLEENNWKEYGSFKQISLDSK